MFPNKSAYCSIAEKIKLMYIVIEFILNLNTSIEKTKRKIKRFFKVKFGGEIPRDEQTFSKCAFLEGKKNFWRNG